MCSVIQECAIGQSDPAWVQHGKCFVWWRVNVILLVDVILSWTFWVLANACIVFIYCKTHKNSLHHFPRVILFLWPSSCICTCVHICIYIQCANILLFVESCYCMLLPQTLLGGSCYHLLHVFFGCLFVMLTSVLIADTTVNLENFHTIYVYFVRFAMCFPAICYLGFAPIWRMCFCVFAKLCLDYFKTWINRYNFPFVWRNLCMILCKKKFILVYVYATIIISDSSLTQRNKDLFSCKCYESAAQTLKTFKVSALKIVMLGKLSHETYT